MNYFYKHFIFALSVALLHIEHKYVYRKLMEMFTE